MRSKGSKIAGIFCATISLCVLFPFVLPAVESLGIKGRIMDIEGKAVQGASLFVYKNNDVRRPADFISAPADKDGKFDIALPPGKYWLVARLKRMEGYGPLMPGDKHSGEPMETEVVAGKELSLDFVVADIKAAARLKAKRGEGYIRVKGRIVDENGRPVGMAYAFADKKDSSAGMPDFLSAWTDKDGNYTLYLPPGKYYVGASLQFPPDGKVRTGRPEVFEADREGVNIPVKSAN